MLQLVQHDPDVAEVRALLLEYQSSIGVDLCFQDFARELADLPGAYAPPRGRLYLALVEDEPAGCVALRPLHEDASEMKRLYVRPAFRGRGIGRLLATQAICDARAIGYQRMVLDTLPAMSAAQALYTALGFVEAGPYTFNPTPGVRFLQLDLATAPDASP